MNFMLNFDVHIDGDRLFRAAISIRGVQPASSAVARKAANSLIIIVVPYRYDCPDSAVPGSLAFCSSHACRLSPKRKLRHRSKIFSSWE